MAKGSRLTLRNPLALAGLGLVACAAWRRRSRAKVAFQPSPGRLPVARTLAPPEAQQWRPEPLRPGGERASVLGYQRAAPSPPDAPAHKPGPGVH